MIDGRYDVRDSDQALFLQRENVRMEFVVPVTPTPGDTNVNRAESPVAHALGTYTDTGSVYITINGVQVPVSLITTYGGILIAAQPGAEELVNQEDGLVHLAAYGDEDVSGTVSTTWTISAVGRPPLYEIAEGQIPIASAVLVLAGGEVTVAPTPFAVAQGELFLYSALFTVGYAGGRLFVGDFVWRTNASVTKELAEKFLGVNASPTYEIHGYAIFNPTSLTLELWGPARHTTASVVVDIAAMSVTVDGSVVANLGNAIVNEDGSITLSILGEQSETPMGRLIVRVSSLPAAVYAELEAAGIKFANLGTNLAGTAESKSAVEGDLDTSS